MDFNLPKIEKEILDFWKKNKIFEKSVEKNKGKKTFVFYEGPPTANGRPGVHHVLARAFKDIILRFQTMRGRFVPRWAGWDTHGLPVEIEVEKELGLKSKKDIENYGIAEFNRKAKDSVWRYKNEWEEMTKRMGFWIDLGHPYITYENSYIETLWWIIKEIWKKGLLYQGHKVVPWCSRCGTTLSSHEIAQGYKEISEKSVYIKFKLKSGQKIGSWTTTDKTYILSWTTTPWTLPGNVALAVGENIDYVVLHIIEDYNFSEGQDYPRYKDGETLILAKATEESVIDGPRTIDYEFKGKDLIGLKYQSLFEIPALQNDKSHQVYPANFVTTTDGTGVVHTAVMYGEDDYQLGVKVGLPQHHTVNEEGEFTNDVPGLDGMHVKARETEEKIIEYLNLHNNLFSTKPYTHEYPFCWRCDTPLLYYARTSWFVAMNKLRDELLKNNKKVHWTPENLQEGRFGEWLREVKDWNFSRERYWGTPLPVWRCDKCKNTEVLGSIKELTDKVPAKNRYILVRHTEARHVVKEVNSCYPEQFENPLTEKGIKDAENMAKSLRKYNPSVIYHSDILRTRQMAEIISRETGAKTFSEPRLRELNVGPQFNNRSVQACRDYYGSQLEEYSKRAPEGESLTDAKKRMMPVIFECEKKYSGKTILIVSHGDPLWALAGAMKGLSDEETVIKEKENHPLVGEFREIAFVNVPRDESINADIHRPFIDGVSWKCDCGGIFRRISEVIDCWFDSGAMPFAQFHYPFENNKKIENSFLSKAEFYPADYIVEAMDQTRGWFYTLLAVATLLGKESPYKNVVSLGLILDKDGQKMSKSKGNVVNPFELFEKYGADVVRFYFYTVNQPGDVKRFNEEDLVRIQRNFFNLFINISNFYQTYKPNSVKEKEADYNSLKTVLDKWFDLRLRETEKKVINNLSNYQVVEAGREIQNLVDDFSRWYLRRSRKIFQKPNSEKELDAAAYNLARALFRLARISAPFIPFLAEHIYQSLKEDIGEEKESIHLFSLIEPEEISKDEALLLSQMEQVRLLASKTLELRAKKGVKVRQPLKSLIIRKDKPGLTPELTDILKEEVNVKEIKVDVGIQDEIEIDWEITPELKKEGIKRELIRKVQEGRQDKDLKPRELASFDSLGIVLSVEEKEIYDEFQSEIYSDTSTTP